jgi:hypothetical protein
LLRQLDRAQLTEEQKVQIKELIAKKADAIVALRQKVAMTPELRKALNEATTKLRAEGKRGAELRSAAAAAAGLSAEQIAAQQELTQAMNQLRREAFSLLTDEQRQAVGRGAQGKAKKKKAVDATDA